MPHNARRLRVQRLDVPQAATHTLRHLDRVFAAAELIREA